MHENREISSAPWSEDQGRSAKATSRTADMHMLEKSDCAVVPVNQPNKEAEASAEVGEGRAQTKENIVPSHMHPTQSGKRMSQGLDGVRKAAEESKEQRFTALLHHLSIEPLRESFYALQRQASPGIDGVTWQEYESGLEGRLIDLCTVERIGQNLQDESLSRRLTDSNVGWASQRWRTRSFSRLW
jgi:RNA-directed DNA polymerase